MKIKITENQHSRLKLVVEQQEYITRYETLCSQKIQDLDKIYVKITSMTIDDLLNMVLNAEQTINIIEKIEADVTKAERSLTNLLDTGAIAGDEELEIKIDAMTEKVMDKITGLTLMLNPIEELQRLQKGHKLNSHFSDVEPMKIQSF